MAVPAAIKRKIARLRSGQPPRFIDLFSGCGGISLGFTTAGFEPIASVELDPKAAESHGASQLHRRCGAGGRCGLPGHCRAFGHP